MTIYQRDRTARNNLRVEHGAVKSFVTLNFAQRLIEGTSLLQVMECPKARPKNDFQVSPWRFLSSHIPEYQSVFLPCELPD